MRDPVGRHASTIRGDCLGGVGQSFRTAHDGGELALDIAVAFVGLAAGGEGGRLEVDLELSAGTGERPVHQLGELGTDLARVGVDGVLAHEHEVELPEARDETGEGGCRSEGVGTAKGRVAQQDPAIGAARDRLAQAVLCCGGSHRRDDDLAGTARGDELDGCGDCSAAVRVELEVDTIAAEASVGTERHRLETRHLLDENCDTDGSHGTLRSLAGGGATAEANGASAVLAASVRGVGSRARQTVGMRTRSKLLPVALLVAAVVALGACSRTFGLRDDASAEEEPIRYETTTTAAEDGATSTTETTQTKPKNSTSTTSKPSKPTTTDDGFGGKPPSFPEFTFTATRNADGTVKVSGSGCPGGRVSLYAESSGSGEGGDPFYANPNASGEWSVTAKLPSGTLKGTCFGVGTSGQSHVGGSHTVTIP